MDVIVPEPALASPRPDDRRLFSPAAARNVQPLCDLLAMVAPKVGNVLEIASGSGEHIVHFASRFPSLHWQPTDIDAERLGSIDAWANLSGLSNIAPAVFFDVTDTATALFADRRFELIVCINLCHLLTDLAVQAAIDNMARRLVPGGTLLIYGPFRRGDAFASKGDEAFDAMLKSQDAALGLKDVAYVTTVMTAATGHPTRRVQLPANNLALVSQPAPINRIHDQGM